MGVRLDTRRLFANATWKSPDGVTHSVGPWGVRCGLLPFRRLPGTPDNARVVTCVPCLAQDAEDYVDETEDED